MNEKKEIIKEVNDLGAAAYAMMHGYKPTGRSPNGKSINFVVCDSSDTSVDVEEEVQKFNNLQLEYLVSPYHHFDSCLMSLKKMSSR